MIMLTIPDFNITGLVPKDQTVLPRSAAMEIQPSIFSL